MSQRPKRAVKKVDYRQGAEEADVAKDNSDDGDADVAMEDLEEHESDVDMTDHEDEVVPEEIELDEAIAEDTEATPKKKSKKKQTAKTKNPAKTPTKSNQDGPKKEIRLTKHMTNVKEKLFRIFGSNHEKVVEILRLRREWEKSMFIFDENQLKKYKPSKKISSLPDSQYSTLSQNQFYGRLALKKNMKLQLENGEVSNLQAGTVIGTENVSYCNVGGLITDVAWLPHESDTDHEILVVAVSDISDTSIAPEFSLLAGKAHTSGFLIYKLTEETGELKLIKAIVHNWGNCWDLKGRIGEGFDVLSAVFSDGKVRLLNFNTAELSENLMVDDDDETIFLSAKTPSYEYSLPDTLITAFDWIEDRIIVGTSEGSVAEFNLGERIPNFVYPLHSGYIFSLRVGDSKYDDTMVYTSCADGSSALFSTIDIRTTKNVTPKSKSISKSVAYSPQLYSFIQLEGQYSATLTPVRALFFVTPLVKHDGSTESISTSNLHPMLLSGGADGKIKITNMARRLLNGQKQALSSHKILTLRELQYGEKEGIYRVTAPLDVETLAANENSNVSNIYPPGVSINAIKWNENLSAGKWYAASSTSGLLIIEKIPNI